MRRFPRVVTAMITPYKEDMSVDYEGAQKIAGYLLDHGSEGLVVAGTTGESPVLSIQEKIDLFQAVKEAVGSKGWVIAGTGTNSTRDAAEMTSAAERVGADAVMAVVPYYNKPNQEGLFRHYQAVASATSKPVMIYNVPGRTGINLQPQTAQRLAQIGNVRAIKDASGNLDQITAMKAALPEDFLIYSGDDSLTLPMMAVGAYGVVSVAAHIAGDLVSDMIYAYLEGRIDEAREAHLKLFPLFKALFITTNPIPVKKAAALIGLPAGDLRLPMVEASPDETAVIEAALAGLGLRGGLCGSGFGEGLRIFA